MVMHKVSRNFVLMSTLLITSACEKEVSISQLTEKDFYGVWEEHVISQREWIDSSFVDIDSIMVLLSMDYDFYKNINGTRVYNSYLSNNPGRADVEAYINGWFVGQSYDTTYVNRLISFDLIDGENVIRCTGEYFNDRPFRTYYHPNGGLELQYHRDDVDSWEVLFSTCYLSEFEKKKTFRYDCDSISSSNIEMLEAVSPDYTTWIKIVKMDQRDFNDKYYEFVR